MREIKFRVWNKDKREWERHAIGMSTSGELITNHNEDFELVQYTGLKDKDGREIYEGDIVRFKFHAGDIVAPVSFRRYKWMLDRGLHSISIDDEISSFLEIIGNR